VAASEPAAPPSAVPPVALSGAGPAPATPPDTPDVPGAPASPAPLAAEAEAAAKLELDDTASSHIN
jgi:hypothetical protein